MKKLSAHWPHLRALFYRWALRGRFQENFPIVLDQRRVYVLPGRAGLAFAVLLLLLLIASMNYNLSLGYALVFLLAALELLSIVQAFRNLLDLRIQSASCAPVFAGQKAQFRFWLENTRSSSRHGLTLTLRHDTGSKETELPAFDPLVELPARGRDMLQLAMQTRQRGWLYFPGLTVSTCWPLGLIRAWSQLEPKLACLVYPQPALQAPPWPLSPGAQGSGLLDQAGQDDFAGLRRHQAGDAPGHIAWKLAARQESGELQTKLFNSQSGPDVWFDWDQLPASWSEEERLSVLCRWICDAHKESVCWGLRLPQKTVSPAQGDAHFHACLRLLALHGHETHAH